MKRTLFIFAKTLLVAIQGRLRSFDFLSGVKNLAISFSNKKEAPVEDREFGKLVILLVVAARVKLKHPAHAPDLFDGGFRCGWPR